MANTVLGRNEAGNVIDIEMSDTGAAVDHPDLTAHTNLGLAATHAHPYSASDHDHAGVYADPHAHPYSADSHDHDAAYSATDHTHAGGDHPDLAAHDTLGLATQAELDAHSHTLTDGDIPAAIARDAEVTSAIATHAATPHGGESGVTLAEVIDMLYPVGKCWISEDSTNPGTLLGRGTWVQTAQGRMIIGQDGSQAEYDTAGETGGAETHTHADHTGVIDHTHVATVTDPQHAHVQGVNSTATGGLSGYTADTTTNTRVNSGYSTSNAATGISVANASPAGAVAALSHDSSSNVPPYIVYYVWKRTA